MAGLFFKKNRIVSRIIHLLATFLWIKKKNLGKVSLCFLILTKSILLSVFPSTAFRQGFNFKLAFKFRTLR